MGVKCVFKHQDEIYALIDIGNYATQDEIDRELNNVLFPLKDGLTIGFEEKGAFVDLFRESIHQWITKLNSEPFDRPFILKNILIPFRKKALKTKFYSYNDNELSSIFIIHKKDIYQIYSTLSMYKIHDFCSAGNHEEVIYSIWFDKMQNEPLKKTVNKIAEKLYERTSKGSHKVVLVNLDTGKKDYIEVSI